MMESTFLSEASLPLQQTAWRSTTKKSNLLVGSSCNWICCYPQGLRCGTIVRGSMQPAIHNTLTREKQLHCGLSPAQQNKFTASPSWARVFRQAVLQPEIDLDFERGAQLAPRQYRGGARGSIPRGRETICIKYIERLQTESVSITDGCVDGFNTHRFLGRKLM